MKTVERAPAELPPLPRLSLARVASKKTEINI